MVLDSVQISMLKHLSDFHFDFHLVFHMFMWNACFCEMNYKPYGL